MVIGVIWGVVCCGFVVIGVVFCGLVGGLLIGFVVLMGSMLLVGLDVWWYGCSILLVLIGVWLYCGGICLVGGVVRGYSGGVCCILGFGICFIIFGCGVVDFVFIILVFFV